MGKVTRSTRGWDFNDTAEYVKGTGRFFQFNFKYQFKKSITIGLQVLQIQKNMFDIYGEDPVNFDEIIFKGREEHPFTNITITFGVSFPNQY